MERFSDQHIVISCGQVDGQTCNASLNQSIASGSFNYLIMNRALTKFCRIFEISAVASRSHYGAQSIRRVSDTSETSKGNSQHDLRTLFREVEKLVGGNASTLSLRYLLSDELSAVAVSFGKLIRARAPHPLSALLRAYVFNEDHVSDKQKRADQLAGRRILSWFSPGTVVMLCGNAVLSSLLPAQANGGVSSLRQTEFMDQLRTLAETVELVHIGSMLHRAIAQFGCDLEAALLSRTATKSQTCEAKQPEDETTVELGNKLSTLTGDYVLAKAAVSLAKLRDTRVTYLIASSIGDAVLSQFDRFATSLESETAPAKRDVIDDDEWRDWKGHVTRLHASLLRNACQSTVLLCTGPKAQAINLQQSHELQKVAGQFASSFCFALILANAMNRQRSNAPSEETDPYALMLCNQLPRNASTANLHDRLAAFCAEARAAALCFADSPHRAGMLRLADSILLSVAS